MMRQTKIILLTLVIGLLCRIERVNAQLSFNSLNGFNLFELTIPNCWDLNQLWKKKYHRILKVSWALQDIACFGPSKDRALAEAAYILENTKFRIDPGLQLFQPPRDMLKFVTDKYLNLSMTEEDSPYAGMSEKTIYFPKGIGNEDGFALVGNLIHESRHLDGEKYFHIPCISGKYFGEESCDNGLTYRFDVGGAHAVAFLYFAWVANQSNWPAWRKIAAKNLVRVLMVDRINASQEVKTKWLSDFIGPM